MSLIIAMSLFALSMSVSPGPVNLVTFSSGLNYGFLPSLPFVAGAALGFTLLLVVVGLGLGEIVALSPVLMQVLAYAGTALICYMGYKIATAHPELPRSPARQPHFFQGAALQWLNPKAWIASLSGVSAFEATLGNGLFLFASLYLVICFFSVAVWAFAGARVSELLRNESNLQWVNRVMGGLLGIVASSASRTSPSMVPNWLMTYSLMKLLVPIIFMRLRTVDHLSNQLPMSTKFVRAH